MFRRCHLKDLEEEITSRKVLLNIDLIKELSDIIRDYGSNVFLSWTKAHSVDTLPGNV